MAVAKGSNGQSPETPAGSGEGRDNSGRFAKGNSVTRQGKPNKVTTDMRNMILRATELAGERLSKGKLEGADAAIEYLATQALAEPKAFLPLLGKCMPSMLKADVGDTLNLLDLVNRSRALEAEMRQRGELPVIDAEAKVVEPSPKEAEADGE